MTRLVHRPVMIDAWQGSDPAAFSDGDVLHRVCMVLDQWQEAGEWWSGETERRLLRVMTDQAAVFDLECVGEDWFIYRVWD